MRRIKFNFSERISEQFKWFMDKKPKAKIVKREDAKPSMTFDEEKEFLFFKEELNKHI